MPPPLALRRFAAAVTFAARGSCRALALVAGLALAACAGAPRNPVPEALVATAALPGYPGIRYWGDDATSIGQATVDLMASQTAAAGRTGRRDFLAISGGGSNGAFGAGLLFGWSAAGNRPEFTIVTGVSTGSLTAPFAFLGQPYDDELRASYTKISGADVYARRGVFGILSSGAAADNTPLRRLVSDYVTDRMVVDIAREYARGRRLLIGTTNLDAERPVVWDIGAIASSGMPDRRQLIEDILVASAAIPGLFPPVRIQVVADGVAYDEMHVDGGTSNQAFMMPSNFDRRLGQRVDRRLYVIRNGKVTPEYAAVKPRLPAVAGRSVAVLIKTQGVGDLYRMYVDAREGGIDFNAIWIPPSFTLVESEPFQPAYMSALFDVGYRMGRTGIPWSKTPPE
jgi:hypothetical protein